MDEYKKITIESYDKTVDDYAHNTDPLHPKEEADKFLSFLKKGASILDIGCGPGRDVKIFSDKGFKVVGIDLSKNMIEAAKKRTVNADFKVMDLMKLEFPDSSFDAEWASAVYLHVPKKDIVKALKEAWRVLKSGGILCTSVKVGEGEVLKVDERYGVKKFWSFFTKDEIEDALEKSGFEVLDNFVEKPDKAYYTNAVVRTICRKPTLIKR
jgi:ubiquinone/menaquinone biosynthesis C-methylase UbiE